MECKNPDLCESKHQQWKKHQEKLVPVGEGILDGIVERLEEGIDIPLSDHANKRSLFRAFSVQEIRNAILNGWVIEYDNTRNTLLVLYNYKVAAGIYRPIHVVIGLNNKPKIITCYDPQSKPWKWDRSYQERICFCR